MKKSYKIILGVIGVVLVLGAMSDDSKKEPKQESVPKNENVVPYVTTETARSFRMGVSQWPPEISKSGVSRAKAFNQTHTDLGVFHQVGGVPWVEMDADKDIPNRIKKDWDGVIDRMPKGAPRYIALSPLSMNRDGLAAYADEKDDNSALPNEWKNLAFNDPKVITAYERYVDHAIAIFDPRYMAIGIELNVFFDKQPDSATNALIELYQKTYAHVKETHPEIKVFATIQLENLNGLIGQKKENIARQERAIQTLLPTMDIFAVSTYPHFVATPMKTIPEDYYTSLARYGKPVAIAESGFNSEDTKITGIKLIGDEEKQRIYTVLLLSSANQMHMPFVVQWAGIDFDKMIDQIPKNARELLSIWSHSGIIRSDDSLKPAFSVWDTYFKLSLRK